jgi:hypothetical protein
MRFLIMLEQTETGFAVQAPDLALATTARTSKQPSKLPAKRSVSTSKPIREAGQQVPEGQGVSNHVENPEFRDLLFAYVDLAEPQGNIAA